MTIVEFGSLLESILNGMNVKQDKSGEGLPITRIETISQGKIDAKRFGYAGLQGSKVDRWLLAPGDILFGHINSVDHLGKCAIYRGEPKKLVHGMNLLCLRADKTKLAPDFGKYLIRSEGFRSRLANCIKKAVNQASISITDLRNVAVTLPALSDQSRIATILDHADDVRAKRRTELVQLEQMAQSIFINMFGHPTVNSLNFPLQELKAVGRVTTGSTPPSIRPGMFGGSVPFITPGDIGNRQPAKRYLTEEGAKSSRLVRDGSALVCCIGATIGKMDKARGRCAFNQQINAVEWGPEIEDDYGLVCLTFLKDRIAEWGASTTLPILKKSSFETIRIPVPDLSLQKRFTLQMRALTALIEASRGAHSLADDLFASLHHRAFRGEL